MLVQRRRRLTNTKPALINPLHAFPGPGPGILILTTMPIPDSVRASLQVIG